MFYKRAKTHQILLLRMIHIRSVLCAWFCRWWWIRELDGKEAVKQLFALGGHSWYLLLIMSLWLSIIIHFRLTLRSNVSNAGRHYSLLDLVCCLIMWTANSRRLMEETATIPMIKIYLHAIGRREGAMFGFVPDGVRKYCHTVVNIVRNNGDK